MTDTPTPQAMTPAQRAELVAECRISPETLYAETIADQLEADGVTIATITAERDAAKDGEKTARNLMQKSFDVNRKVIAERDAAQAEIARLTAALATPDQIAALAAERAATVTVKPLVWEDIAPHHIAPHHSKAALPLFGSIRAESWGGDYSVVWSVPGMCDTFTHGKWATIDAAKAAAQADYDARIHAAITITSGTDSAKMHKAVEALRWYAEQVRLCRLIHGEGDAGRNALAADGGAKANAALAEIGGA